MVQPSRVRYKATVIKIIEGTQPPYVVTVSDKLGSVTFSLVESVWKEKSRPRPGELVYLSDVRQHPGGWRAQRARFVRPTDEATAE